MTTSDLTRDQLIELLNEDLSREYQAIIAYVIYSQVLKGAAVHGHRQGARGPRGRRVGARDHDFQTHRLPGRHTDHEGLSGEAIGERPKSCFAPTWTTRTRPSATTASVSGSAKRCRNMRLPKTSAKSCARSKSTRRISRPRSERTCQTFPGWESRGADSSASRSGKRRTWYTTCSLTAAVSEVNYRPTIRDASARRME